MADSNILPGARQPLVDNSGHATLPFYRFFQSLERLQNSGAAGLQAQITAIATALGSPDGTVAKIPDVNLSGFLRDTTQLLGNQSVAAVGTLGNGVVILTLVNDTATPGNTYYYGSDGLGVRGWHPVSDALSVSSNLTLTVGADGVATFDLADVADSGAGSLLAITRDAKGRVTGTKAATITGTAGRVTVSNGDAAAGLPTIDLDPAVQSLLSLLLAIAPDLRATDAGAYRTTDSGAYRITA